MKKKVLILLIFLGLFTSLVVFAQGQCNPNQVSSSLCNPIGGATNLKDFALKALIVYAGFTTTIPILGIVFAGFLMLISQGNPETTKRAKEALTWTIYGFILAISSYILIAATINFIGATNIPDPNSPGPAIVNPLADTDFTAFLKNMLVNFLEIVGVIAILVLIINGFRYITASGNEEQASEAKEGLKWSIAGIVSILLAYVIIRAVATFFGLP